MSNLAFELNASRETKAPMNSGMPMGRMMELTAAAADAQASCERWHAELQSVQEQHRARTHELRQITRLHEQKTSEVNRLLSLETSLNDQLGKLNGHRELLLGRLQEINARYLQDQGRLEQTQQQLREWDSQKQSVEAQVTATAKQLTGLKAEAALLDERSSEISDLLQKAIDEVTRQQERIAEARGQVVRHETRQQELTVLIARLEVNTQQAEANLKLKQERLNYLEDAGTKATGHVVDLTTRYQFLEKEYALLTAQCREGEASLNQTRTAIASERARLQETRLAVEQTSRHQADLEHSVTDLANQRVAAAAALGELQAEAVQQEQALALLRRQRADSQTEMDKLRACEQTIAEALMIRRNELAHTEERLGIALNECTEAAAQLADRRRTVAELETLEADAERHIQQFTEDLAALNAKHLQVRTHITETEATLAALGEQHRALGTEIALLSGTRQTTADSVAACRAELANTEERLQSTRNDCQVTEAKLAALSQHLQARQEEEALLTDRIHAQQQQTQQLEIQTQEQTGKLEALRQERIDAEIAVQRIGQQHEEAGIRLEARHAEIDTAAVRLQQTLDECHQAEERRMALGHEVENLLMRQQNQEMILREIEAQIARREHERETAATAARQAQQEHETAAAIVVAVRRELAEQQASVAVTTSKLTELQSTVQATEHHLTATSANLAGQEQKLMETRSALETVAQELALAHDLKVTLEELTSRQASVAAAEQHLGALGRQVDEASQRRAQLDTAISEMSQELTAATARCDAANHQETESRQRLEQLTTQEKDLRQEIANLTTSAQQERVMYDELRSLSKEARHLHEEETAALAGQVKEVRQQLHGWETQIAALLDWKERMDLSMKRLQLAEADSAESRSANDEIHMALGALRHIMERLQSSLKENAGSPSRPGTTEVSTTSRTTNAHSGEAKNGSHLPTEGKPSSRLSRLREDLQREETRLHFLRQNSRSLELRARNRPHLQLVQEDQASQNGSAPEGSSHWEERLKRATLDEQNLLEKIASLKEQIAQVRGEVPA